MFLAVITIHDHTFIFAGDYKQITFLYYYDYTLTWLGILHTEVPKVI